MYRGTTPIFTLNIKSDIDFTEIKEMWITLEDSKTEITYALSEEQIVLDVENKKAEISLSQVDTLKFRDSAVKMQTRILMNNGIAYASAIKKLDLNDILREGVIE